MSPLPAYIHVFTLFTYGFLNTYACSGGKSDTTTIADASGNKETENNGPGSGSGSSAPTTQGVTEAEASETEAEIKGGSPEGQNPDQNPDETTGGGQGQVNSKKDNLTETETTEVGPRDDYDVSKCKHGKGCAPYINYLGKDYKETCVKGDDGDAGRRPWCADEDHVNKAGEFEEGWKKICCDCPDWPGKKEDCSADVENCPSSAWVKRKEGCYFFGVDRVDFDVARHICKKKLGRLVSIETKTEAQYLAHYINVHGATDDFWIGASDRYGSAEGNWQWDYNGKPLNYTGFTNWAKGEPQKGVDCLHLDKTKDPISNYKWKAAACKEKKFFLCESSQK